MTRPDKLPPEKLIALAQAHIRHFHGLMESGSSNVRIDECVEYSRIWRTVIERHGIWDKLSEQAKIEIKDAVYSGEYDEILEEAV